MSLGSEHFADPILNPLSDWEVVVGTFEEVKERCDLLHKAGFRYSKGGYVKLEDGKYTRTMYLFN